ncbi:MAG: hypothetical protein AB7O59_16685 [Pirellulales bacterium]
MQTVAAPPPDKTAQRSDDDDVMRQMGEFMPSWLTSLVFHLTLVLLLTLIVADVGSSGTESISLDFQSSSPGLDDGSGALEDAVAIPSELPESAEDPSEQMVEPIPEPTAESLEIKLAEVPRESTLTGALPGGDLGDSGDVNTDQPGEGDDGIKLGPVRTGVFGVSGEGERFVYVFDRSESMNSELTFSSEGTVVFSVTPLVAAKAELLKSLNDLGGGHDFGMVFYNHGPWVFTLGNRSRTMFSATRENKRRATQFITSMYGQGKTNHMKPVEIALRMHPDVIFLMTDGEPKDDLTRTELDQLKRLNSGRTKINVVQFCYKEMTGGALVDLANENGGKHEYFNIAKLGPKGPGDLPPPVEFRPGPPPGPVPDAFRGLDPVPMTDAAGKQPNLP